MDDAQQLTLNVDGFPLVIVETNGRHYLDLHSLARRLRTSFAELERIAVTKAEQAAQVRAFPGMRCLGIERQAVRRALLSRCGLQGDAAHISGFRAAWPVADAVLAVREGERVGLNTAAMLRRHGFSADARTAVERRRERA